MVSYLFLSMASLYGQDKKVVGVMDYPKLIRKVIKQEGWNIPTPNEKDSLSISQTILNNQTITVKKYLIPKRVDTQLEIYSLSADGSLTTAYQNIQLAGLVTYSLNGKIFACRMNAVATAIDANGSRVPVPAITPLYYSDENGDGKFETRFTGQVETTIPSWAISTKK